MRDGLVGRRLSFATLTWVGHVDCIAVMNYLALLVVQLVAGNWSLAQGF